MEKGHGYAVFYFSRGGSTRKVAEVIAGTLKAKALDVKGAFLLAGSGVYGRKAGREMMDFLESIPP